MPPGKKSEVISVWGGKAISGCFRVWSVVHILATQHKDNSARARTRSVLFRENIQLSLSATNHFSLRWMAALCVWWLKKLVPRRQVAWGTQSSISCSDAVSQIDYFVYEILNGQQHKILSVFMSTRGHSPAPQWCSWQSQNKKHFIVHLMSFHFL